MSALGQISYTLLRPRGAKFIVVIVAALVTAAVSLAFLRSNGVGSGQAVLGAYTGHLDHFVLSAASSSPTAGQGDNLTITAKDAGNRTVTSYTGNHSLTFSGASTIGSFKPTVTDASGNAVAFGTLEQITFTNGVATVSGSSNGVMKLYKAESPTITVSDGSHIGTVTLSVRDAGAASFNVTPATFGPTAGTPFNVTVAALDAYGNPALSNYTGTQRLDLSGPHSSPAPSSNAPTWTGTNVSASFNTSAVATISTTLYDAETVALTAKDHTNTAISGTSGSLTVSDAGAASFSIANAGAQTAGSSFGLTITALDSYSNVAKSYGGAGGQTKTLDYSGANSSPNNNAPSYPSSATSITFASGVGTPSGITLYNAAPTTLTVKDHNATSISGQTTFTVNASTPASISKTAGDGQSAFVNTAFATALKLTVQDLYANPEPAGISVTFTAPASGASGTFANSTATTTVSTVSGGTATATTYTANGTAGNYNVSAQASGGSNPSVNFSLTNYGAWTWKANGAAQTWSTNSNTAEAVAYPSGTTSGDLLLLTVIKPGNATDVASTPSGWTLLGDMKADSNNGLRVTVFWRPAGSETSVSVTPGTSDPLGASAWVVRYERPAGVGPAPASAATAMPSGTGSANTTFTPTGVMTTAANATVISIVGVPAANTLSLSTAQSFTLEARLTSSSPGAAFGLADRFVGTVGAVTAPTWQSSGSADWAAVTGAFN